MNRRSAGYHAEELPALLTVEEAARLLRLGRTKAYALAKEWRATGGRSGLPVIDFGDVLRVPRHALEELAGGELAPRPSAQPPADGPAGTAAAHSQRRRTRHRPSEGQSQLFEDGTR